MNPDKYYEDYLENSNSSDFLFLGKKCSKKRLPWSERKDVIHKKLLRCIKKFFVLKFKSKNQIPRFLSNSYKSRVFKRKFSSFCTELFHQSAHFLSQSDAKHIQNLLLNFLYSKPMNPIHFSVDEALDDRANEFYLKFKECCRRYNHRKFLEVIEHPLFRKLFLLFKHSLTIKYASQLIFCNRKEYRTFINDFSEYLEKINSNI
jgi:hypothetical protein